LLLAERHDIDTAEPSREHIVLKTTPRRFRNIRDETQPMTESDIELVYAESVRLAESITWGFYDPDDEDGYHAVTWNQGRGTEGITATCRDPKTNTTFMMINLSTIYLRALLEPFQDTPDGRAERSLLRFMQAVTVSARLS
jgi:hypothetical protein